MNRCAAVLSWFARSISRQCRRRRRRAERKLIDSGGTQPHTPVLAQPVASPPETHAGDDLCQLLHGEQRQPGARPGRPQAPSPPEV
jgi:hypothetical protein